MIIKNLKKMNEINNEISTEDYLNLLKILRRLQTIKGHLFSKL